MIFIITQDNDSVPGGNPFAWTSSRMEASRFIANRKGFDYYSLESMDELLNGLSRSGRAPESEE